MDHGIMDSHRFYQLCCMSCLFSLLGKLRGQLIVESEFLLRLQYLFFFIFQVIQFFVPLLSIAHHCLLCVHHDGVLYPRGFARTLRLDRRLEEVPVGRLRCLLFEIKIGQQLVDSRLLVVLVVVLGLSQVGVRIVDYHLRKLANGVELSGVCDLGFRNVNRWL